MTHRKMRVTKEREASVLHPIVGGKPQFSRKLKSVSNITNETPNTLSAVLKTVQKQYEKKLPNLQADPSRSCKCRSFGNPGHPMIHAVQQDTPHSSSRKGLVQISSSLLCSAVTQRSK